MDLKAQPWIADSRVLAALDIFVSCHLAGNSGGCRTLFLTFSRVFGSGFFYSVCFSPSLFKLCLALVGEGFVAFFVLLIPPPLSVGAGPGNRASRLWHRTRFRSFGLGSSGSGLKWFVAYPVLFSFLDLPIPPHSRVESLRRSGQNGLRMLRHSATSIFVQNLSLFRRHFLASSPLRVT